MENRISNWITSLIGGSFIALIIFGALIFLIIDLARGEYEVLLSPTTYKFMAVSVLYVISLYLVGTLPHKSVQRRAYSWAFSVIFHTGLLLYIAIVLEAGGAAFVVGLVETGILLLSTVGLFICLKNKSKNKV